METYEYEKYVTDKENLRSTLDQYGVAIIPDVISEEECAALVSGLWDFFEGLTREWSLPLCRAAPETWHQFAQLRPLHSMLVQHWGAGHCQASWDLRQNAKCADAFASLWGVDREQLLVSFDGLSFAMPPETVKRGWTKAKTWNEFECIQSWVTGLDVNEGDATLGVMEGSHALHRAFAKEFSVDSSGDWFKLSEQQEQWYLSRGCSHKRIKCRKGAMVFWDSRTIHCGVEALPTRAQPNMRAVVYLCYQPRFMCDKNGLAKKKAAFAELRTTSHWPCKVKLFDKSPRSYGQPLPAVTLFDKSPRLSPLGLTLAGLIDQPGEAEQYFQMEAEREKEEMEKKVAKKGDFMVEEEEEITVRAVIKKQSKKKKTTH